MNWRIRAAVQLGATLFDRALEVLRPGIKETEVAAEMEYAARRRGRRRCRFRPSSPQGKVGVAARESYGAAHRCRGFVVCDFGVILAGYCSDQTRTVWVGAPSKDARHAYESVREAQQAAIAAVRPGISVGEVDAAARKVLRKAGLGRYFTHSTGHGVGLEIHESPGLQRGKRKYCGRAW
jgi:Xaa-Pro aminopeptidase